MNNIFATFYVRFSCSTNLSFLYSKLNFQGFSACIHFLVKDDTGNIKELLKIMINQFYYSST